MSGINLLQYKSGRGVIGQTCYGRYLREAYNLISKYGGGLYYFGEVRCCVSPAGGTIWCAVAGPLFPQCMTSQEVPRCHASLCAELANQLLMLMEHSIHVAGRG